MELLTLSLPLTSPGEPGEPGPAVDVLAKLRLGESGPAADESRGMEGGEKPRSEEMPGAAEPCASMDWWINFGMSDPRLCTSQLVACRMTGGRAEATEPQ